MGWLADSREVQSSNKSTGFSLPPSTLLGVVKVPKMRPCAVEEHLRVVSVRFAVCCAPSYQ